MKENMRMMLLSAFIAVAIQFILGFLVSSHIVTGFYISNAELSIMGLLIWIVLMEGLKGHSLDMKQGKENGGD